MGSTIPVVPRMEMPPAMPRRGLKVFFARRSPSGTEMTASSPPDQSARAQTSSRFSRIIRRGTLLMAAAPTGWSRPGFVTRPTPGPPSMTIPGSSRRDTRAKMRAPSVTSGSSPASLAMAQET